MGQLTAQIIQCAIAIVIGCYVFWVLQGDPNPKVPMFGALFCGVLGAWLVMKAYVFLRYGWNAMLSMKLDGD